MNVDVSIEPTLLPAIEQFVNRLGAASKEQILRFFSAHHKDTVLWCLERLIHNPKLNFDEKSNLLVPRIPTIRKPELAEAMQKAVWILSEFGDVNVLDYAAMNFPQSLLIVTTDNHVYDVTVITARNVDAVLAVGRIYKAQNTPEMARSNDVINHIALVSSKSIGEKLRGAGYDSYCILEPRTNRPRYFTW